MGTTSSAIFKGSSAYSTDFANVIDRAVAIASLPVQQLTNDKADLTSQSDELTKIDTKFGLLQTAIRKIGTAMGGGSYQTEVSAENVVDVSVADGAMEGVYAMKVTSIGAFESSMSARNWSVAKDPSGKPTTFTLVAGNQNFSVTPVDNSARAVADAINASYGNLVQATTVNVAPGDTRISLKSLTLGQTTLDLLQIPSSSIPVSLQSPAPGGYSVSQTTTSWDASGDPATYTLVLGGDQHDIAPASNSAADVVSAINAAYGDQVRAAVVDLKPDAGHDYRVSLQSVNAGPMNGSMTLDLKRGGTSLQTQQTAATSRTTAAWDATADAPNTRTAYTLVAGVNKFSFTAQDNSAASVAAAINSLYGAQVQASVIDLHTGGNPDYRISLQSRIGLAIAFDIQKTTGASFQKEQTAGALAEYEINSSGVTNTSASRNIVISEGVTATLLGTSGQTPANITVLRSTSALNDALSGFADAYNAAVDELQGQRGQNGGALGGQALVSQLSTLLSSISTYTSGDRIGSLAALGLDLGIDGRFTYNQFTLISADLSASASVASFIGSADRGGFLKAATDAMNNAENSTTGLIKTSESDLKNRIAKLGATITAKQNSVNALQVRLQNQMAAADALIAAMEQQSTYFSNMFAAQQSANEMYK